MDTDVHFSTLFSLAAVTTTTKATTAVITTTTTASCPPKSVHNFADPAGLLKTNALGASANDDWTMTTFNKGVNGVTVLAKADGSSYFYENVNS